VEPLVLGCKIEKKHEPKPIPLCRVVLGRRRG
jgi:hypothetical protein